MARASLLVPVERWEPFISDGHSSPGRIGLLPSPVATQDLLIYFNPWTESFEARSIRPGSAHFGRIGWHCCIHRSDLPYASSPVLHGSLLYTVTAAPNYVHRLSLVTGQRQICRLRLRAQPGSKTAEFPEVPGKLFPDTPPLLFDLPDVAKARAGVAKVLVLVTTDGVCVLDLPDSPRNDVLTGCFLPPPRAEHYGANIWSKPSGLGSCILATSQNSCAALYLDMSDYPDRVYQDILPLAGLSRDFRWHSPSVGICSRDTDSRSLCWYASDDLHEKSTLVLFTPPAFTDNIEIPYAGRTYRSLESALGPVTDGCSVYVPALNSRRDSLGLTSYNGVGDAVRLELRPPGIDPLFSAVAKHELVYPGSSSLFRLDTMRAETRLEEWGCYAGPGAKSACASRAIVAAPYVFVQCWNFIGCFQLIS